MIFRPRKYRTTRRTHSGLIYVLRCGVSVGRSDDVRTSRRPVRTIDRDRYWSIGSICFQCRTSTPVPSIRIGPTMNNESGREPNAGHVSRTATRRIPFGYDVSSHHERISIKNVWALLFFIKIQAAGGSFFFFFNSYTILKINNHILYHQITSVIFTFILYYIYICYLYIYKYNCYVVNYGAHSSRTNICGYVGFRLFSSYFRLYFQASQRRAQ